MAQFLASYLLLVRETKNTGMILLVNHIWRAICPPFLLVSPNISRLIQFGLIIIHEKILNELSTNQS
jgi:hypothetical protein